MPHPGRRRGIGLGAISHAVGCLIAVFRGLFLAISLTGVLHMASQARGLIKPVILLDIAVSSSLRCVRAAVMGGC